MKKSVKIMLIAVGILAAMWCAVFATDFMLVRGGGKPIFVIPYRTADDGGSGTYLGLGYTAEIDMLMDAEHGVYSTGAELRIFGKVVAGWIACPGDFVPDEFEMAEYSIDGLDFIYNGIRYSLTEHDSHVNAIMSATPVGEHIVIEGHVNPKNNAYFIFDAREEKLEEFPIYGCNLIWRDDDITTAVYSFWESIYTYDGVQIAQIKMDVLTEFIRDLTFTASGEVLVTISSESQDRSELIALP